MIRSLGLFLLCLSLAAFQTAGAETATAPQDALHLGVASCAGSPCHGSVQTKKTTDVQQNEYLTWQRRDKHAKAFLALESDLGERIARNLGLPNAETAKICLDCHADNVPADRRGVEFQLSDGVGCETCHGGAERWLGPHAGGKVPHDALVTDDGLYPTDRPRDRARLCLSCHEGDETRFVTHRIMGAGHPRLVFELDTFSQIQPAHFVVDDLYRRRKQAASGIQIWAVGQALQLERLMISLADPRHRGDGGFPELVFFDCGACHHSANALRWQRRASVGLGPGVPHVNDANAVMLRVLAHRLAPNVATDLDRDMPLLQKALAEGLGDPHALAKSLAATAHHLGDLFDAHDFGRDDMISVLTELAGELQSGDAADYAIAEQATMAFASIIDTLRTGHFIDAAQFATLKTALDQCYAATQKEDTYEPPKFAAAAQAVAKAIPSR
jgi:Cytochrome c554 and c-prime